jgi:hypothetical protein
MGGRLLEEELAITAISNEEQALVTMDWHGLAVGDLLYVTGCEGEIGALLNGGPGRCARWSMPAICASPPIRAALPLHGLRGGSTRTAPPVVAPAPSVPPVTPAPTPPVIYYGGSGRFGRGELN